MNEVTYLCTDAPASVFAESGDDTWLNQLFGMDCGFYGRDEGPYRARGLFTLDTSLGRYETGDLKPVAHALGGQAASFTWEAAGGRLRVESRWALSPHTGVWSRQDTLRNSSAEDVIVRRCLARFVFSPGHYEVYSQDSRWGTENQGLWHPLNHGSIVLANEGGRTTQGGTPYAVLREVGRGAGVAFHIIPRGNWILRVSAHTHGNGSLPFAVVELGLADGDLQLRLAAGESIELPEVLVQAVPHGEPHLAAPALHRYLLEHHYAGAKRVAPVVYNTWFDVFDVLGVPRLRQQLAAAKELGCEVFTIDAGWYGGGEGHWAEQTGDWREKTNAAFHGRMLDFANEVRTAGLGFGIWIEPERIGPQAPVLSEHPDWFIPTNGPNHYPDLENPAVRAYLRAEFARLIDTYRLAWIKVDFNFEIGPDPRGAALARYYGAWYGLLDELRQAYPQVYFEGCSSGAMRSDIHTMAHFDGHFLSDVVNAYDVLRIYQGALLRSLPGRWCKWAVLRSAGTLVPRYLSTLDDAPETLITPGGAVWQPALTIDLDLAARVALCGMFGVSGDIAGLSLDARGRLREHVEFYKQWRETIAGAIAHLLTPPQPKADHAGWAAIQLQHPDHPASLLFAHRLDDEGSRHSFSLRGLDAGAEYTVTRHLDEPAMTWRANGAALMARGITVELAGRNSAAVFSITQA